MRWVATSFVVSALMGGMVVFAGPLSEAPPSWAFPTKPPNAPVPPRQDPKQIERVAGSGQAYTAAQLQDEFFAPAWFPAEHPPMPKSVGVGDRPGAWPCAYCHQETGEGGPESAALTGLSVAYITEQLAEFRSGRRRAAEPRMQAPHGMEAEARKVTPVALAEAAVYYAGLTYRSRLAVVESDSAPKVAVHAGLIYAKTPTGGTEPLLDRIVEVPDDVHQWDLGNPHMTFTVFVPKGSIARGARLVAANGGGIAPCSYCHGIDYRGSAAAPPLAGRSPSYLARQLFDIQHGTRTGPTVVPMIPVVAHMSAADRVAIVAYLASLKP